MLLRMMMFSQKTLSTVPRHSIGNVMLILTVEGQYGVKLGF